MKFQKEVPVVGANGPCHFTPDLHQQHRRHTFFKTLHVVPYI